MKRYIIKYQIEMFNGLKDQITVETPSTCHFENIERLNSFMRDYLKTDHYYTQIKKFQGSVYKKEFGVETFLFQFKGHQNELILNVI